MRIKYHNAIYEFRPCDTKGMTKEFVEQKAKETGRMQYEYNHVWLVIPGIGYGMEDYGAKE